MNRTFDRRIPNTLEALTHCMAESTTFLEELGAPMEACFAVNLVLEEMITNTIKYGYRDTASHEIDINMVLEPGEVSLTITDDGEAFDPFDQPEPDTTLPAEERSIGGLGLHLVKNMMNSCTYTREDGKNIVRILKKYEH